MNTPILTRGPAPWATELNGLLSEGEPDPTRRFAQLATVNLAGHPEVRTMVIREIRPEAGQLVFHTDGRSTKSLAISAHPQVELCWYLVGPWLQFRLQGEAKLYSPSDGGEDVAAAWASLSPKMQESFFWGAPRSPKAVTPDGPGPDALPGPAPSFRVGVITVEQVIRLDLQQSPHHRLRYSRQAEGWLEEPLW